MGPSSWGGRGTLKPFLVMVMDAKVWWPQSYSLGKQAWEKSYWVDPENPQGPEQRLQNRDKNPDNGESMTKNEVKKQQRETWLTNL